METLTIEPTKSSGSFKGAGAAASVSAPKASRPIQNGGGQESQYQRRDYDRREFNGGRPRDFNRPPRGTYYNSRGRGGNSRGRGGFNPNFNSSEHSRIFHNRGAPKPQSPTNGQVANRQENIMPQPMQELNQYQQSQQQMAPPMEQQQQYYEMDGQTYYHVMPAPPQPMVQCK